MSTTSRPVAPTCASSPTPPTRWPAVARPTRRPGPASFSEATATTPTSAATTCSSCPPTAATRHSYRPASPTSPTSPGAGSPDAQDEYRRLAALSRPTDELTVNVQPARRRSPGSSTWPSRAGLNSHLRARDSGGPNLMAASGQIPLAAHICTAAPSQQAPTAGPSRLLTWAPPCDLFVPALLANEVSSATCGEGLVPSWTARK